MSLVNDVAATVAAEMTKKTDKLDLAQINPLLVEIIAQVLVEVLKAVMDCYKEPKKALATVQRPGVLQRFRLRRAIKRHIDDDEAYGYMGNDMLKAFTKVAETVTEEDLKKLYAEAR